MMTPASTSPDQHRITRPKLPVGVSDFGKLIREDYIFADKTLMIRELLEDGSEVNLITRPRRFGKTLNLSMLQHFFSREVRGLPTAGMFDKLAIGREPECMAHQGQYPVIFFTFKGVKEGNVENTLIKLKKLISDLYEQYPELTQSTALSPTQKANIQTILEGKIDAASLSYAFRQLSEYLYLHYKKPVLMLIDEYDTPIHSAYSHGYYQEIAEVMRNLLGEGLKDNPYLFKAMVTGILRVSRESLFSGLNNLAAHTVLNGHYSQAFGFTEPEVAALLKTPGLQLANPALEQTLEQMKTWYNGYRFGEATIYNCWSIINCLYEQGACRPYWVNTSDNNVLKQLMAKADYRFKQQMERLLQDHVIEQLIDPNIVFGDLHKSAMALWSLLLFSGYLTAEQTKYNEEGQATCRLRIPNREIQGLYRRHIEEWFSDTMGQEDYGAFLRCLVTGNLEEFKARLQDYLQTSTSFFDGGQTHPEKFYHGLVLGLITGLRNTHLVYSNRESGYGRYDVAILPRESAPKDQRLGVLLEFKVAKNKQPLSEAAEQALQQITDQRYPTELEQHPVERILKIGMAFCGKEVEISTLESVDS